MILNQTSSFDILDDNDDNGEEYYLNYIFNPTYNTLQDIIEDDEFIDLTTTATATATTLTQNIPANSMEEDGMPEYLLSKNKLFDSIFPSNTNELRQMAYCLHQINYNKYMYDLWTKYFQAGISKLNSTNTQQYHYWIDEIKSLLESQSNIDFSQMTNEEKHLAYQTIASEQLNQYDKEFRNYRNQWNEKKNLSQNWTLDIEQTMGKFIQQYNMIPLEMKYKYEIELLNYDYDNYCLEYQFQQQQQPQPTIYQKHQIDTIYQLELQLETAKYQLIEYQERLRFNKPPAIYDTLEILPLSNNETISRRYENLIQKTKLNLISTHLLALEIKINEYQNELKQQIDTMWQNYHHPKENQIITKELIEFIIARSKNMTQKLKLTHEFTMNYSIRNSYEQLLTINFKRISFISNLLINTNVKNIFTEQELKLLNRGPSYIVPAQLHNYCSTNEIMHQILKKQYAPLKHQLALFFDKYKINLSRQNNFTNSLWKDFQYCYSMALPLEIEQRAQYEIKLIHSIQTNLKNQNLILRRTADDRNQFYLGSLEEFHQICHQYMETTTTNYYLLMDRNTMKQEQMHIDLHKKFTFINYELEKLFKNKKITEELYDRLSIKIQQIQLPYLYFLPNYSMDNNILTVKPIIQAHLRRSSTGKIANFIYHLLHSHVNNIIKSSLFENEMDFIQKFNNYIYKERYSLQPTTLFVTMKIKNYTNLISHSTIITQLGYFFMDYSEKNKFPYTTTTTTDKIHYISMNTIQELIRLVLENTFFYYNEKIYGFTCGGPTNFLLNDLLFNIYLFVWQKQIIQLNREFHLNEFYGRYNDQVFFTWNRSKEELDQFLQLIRQHDQSIQLEISINKSISFLNIQIQNNSGQLYTSIQTSKYNLPYANGHPNRKYQSWFQFALIRALCCCTLFNDFLQEQTKIQITYLLHGYSNKFIQAQLKSFYLFLKVEEQNFRYCYNQIKYEQIRQRLLDFIINEQRQKLEQHQHLEDNNQLIHFYYLYDYGLYQQFSAKFFQHWTTYIKDDTKLKNQEIKIDLQVKHIYSLNTLLTQEKPSNKLFKELQDF